MIFFSSIFPVNRHMNRNHEHHKRSLDSSDVVVSKENPNCYFYKKYKIPKIFFEFMELSPLFCMDFIFYVIDEYAFTERKDALRSGFYGLFPEDVWAMLNSTENFDCQFIEMINEIYDKNEFVLIYKTRMTIEFMMFVFNTKEKTSKYPYAYFNNIDLKKVLHNLLDFANEVDYLLEDKFTNQQIEDFKKFLHKYISQKSINNMSFLNDLKSFKYILDIFSKDKTNVNLSFAQQFGLVNRFITIFNK